MVINYSSMLHLCYAQCNFSLLVKRYIHDAIKEIAFTSLFKVKHLFRLFTVLSKLYEHSKSTLYNHNTSHIRYTKDENPTLSATKQLVNPAEANSSSWLGRWIWKWTCPAIKFSWADLNGEPLQGKSFLLHRAIEMTGTIHLMLG